MKYVVVLGWLAAALILSSCAPPRLEGDRAVQPRSAIRTDGLYIAHRPGESDHYLRFYPDGTVIGRPFAGEISLKTAARSLDKDAPQPVPLPTGRYTVQGSEIKFSLTVPRGAVDYKGRIGKDTLSLTVYSHMSGNRSDAVYEFVEVK